MIVHRIAGSPFHLDLSGRGAELHGGRWNPKGIPMLYTSESRALACSEKLVHLIKDALPGNQWMVSIEVPDSLPLLTWPEKLMADGVNPFVEPMIFNLVEGFLSDQKDIGIWVPSAVVRGDKNLLLNPRHPDFQKVIIVESVLFDFDPRLFK